MFTTPRSRAPPNRIWTSGQKMSKAVVHRPRSSVVLTFEEPLVKLPLVPATSTGSVSLLDIEWEKEYKEDTEAQRGVPTGEGDPDDGEHPQKSLTLQELLLEADTSESNLICRELSKDIIKSCTYKLV